MRQKIGKLSGFGLLDILLTLAISAVIIVLGISYYVNLKNEQKINQTINQIQQIKQEIFAMLTAASTTTKMTSPVYTPNTINSVLKLAPSTLISVWDRSAMNVSGVHPIQINSLNCNAAVIAVCGIPLKQQTPLTNKFSADFQYATFKINNNCINFSICMQ